MHRETYFTADFDTAGKPYQVRDGASGRIRTSDRSVRSRVLYPAELPGASGDYRYLIRIFITESTENMVHPGGFEPPTARFVAEYSIQLSYGCIGKLTLLQILIPRESRIK